MKKSLGKVWRERKSVYLCNPVTKQGHLKRTWASGRESEILRLVEAKSMFRKYTEKKAETILKQKRKGEKKNGKQL